MWYWYILTFITGASLGCLGMAILACGARADDRTEMIKLNEQFKEWEEERIETLELLKNA